MSLRTKILAAIVGLNLAALLAPVAILLLAGRGDADPGVPAPLVALLARVQALDDPAKDSRAKALEALRAGPGVLEVVFLEEDGDARVWQRPFSAKDEGREAPPRRAAELFAEARRLGRLRVADTELAAVLEREPVVGHGPADDREPPGAGDPPADGEPGAPGEPPATRTYQGVYLRWAPPASPVEGVRDLYLFVLAGILLQTLVAWSLLSRLIVAPLRQLARAADRIAAGDHAARVETTGSGDEFDRTAAAFNRMAGEMAEYQEQLEHRVLQALGRIRKAEQHLAIAQRLAATGTLASGIAHEINNPLGGMRNAVKAIARGDLDPKKTAEYLDLVLDGLSRIEDTVKKVLQFTPRGGRPRPTDLADVARKAVALARHRAERRRVEVEEHLPQGPVPVFGDPHELQQVALNLVLNAVDAIPPGSDGKRGRVDVSVESEDEAVVLRVTDDGVGMTPEVAAQCFDLFFTTKDVGEGTGLGLAVVHTIVTNHGGRIEVDSAPGKGSTFRVVLPREPAASEAETPAR